MQTEMGRFNKGAQNQACFLLIFFLVSVSVLGQFEREDMYVCVYKYTL